MDKVDKRWNLIRRMSAGMDIAEYSAFLAFVMDAKPSIEDLELIRAGLLTTESIHA